MKTKLISKILGVGLALGLVFSLGAAFVAAPAAQADEMEWGAVHTPSWDDLVILPASDIIDYAIGGDEGDIVYAVLELDGSCTDVGYAGLDSVDTPWYALVKSDDGGVTWSDITENVVDASSLPFGTEAIVSLNLVAVAPDDDDWLAVAGYANVAPTGGILNTNQVAPFVVASEDGGDNFTYAHPVVDGGECMLTIADMAVSIENDGIHNIALAGTATVGGVIVIDPVPGSTGPGAVFRLEAGTWLTGGWVDTRCYDGWDGSTEDPCTALDWTIYSRAVVAVDFSPNFDMDDTIVAMSVGGPEYAAPPPGNWYYHYPYLQEGTLDGDGAWNGEAGFDSAPIQITDEGANLLTFYARYMMGFALPADFDGAEPADNNIYFYVNAIPEPTGPGIEAKGYVMISEDGALTGRCGPSGDPLLASIDVHGDADTCKAMVGTLGADVDFGESITPVECCTGVAVYHTVELDDCCPEWESACKDPSGPGFAVVSYTPDGEKGFATTSGSRSFLDDNEDSSFPPIPPVGWGQAAVLSAAWSVLTDWTYTAGNPLDESAFSVSLDDAVSFNQIGLIDTDVDWLSDVAVCPDCSVIYLSTINEGIEQYEGGGLRRLLVGYIPLHR